MAKTVYFARHGQSLFNLLGNALDRERTGLSCWEAVITPDAPLTQEGIQQCLGLQKELDALPVQARPQLAVCSPLRRALHTASIAVQNLGTPVLCVGNCREHRQCSCDFGSPLSELREAYPNVTFDPSLAEEWWFSDGLPARPKADFEPTTLFEYRVRAFEHWLRQRPEQRLLVVAHGVFLGALLPRLGCHLDHHMRNCELVTVQLPPLSPQPQAARFPSDRHAIVVLGTSCALLVSCVCWLPARGGMRPL